MTNSITEGVAQHLKEVFRGTSYGLLLRIAGALIAFCFSWLLARILGPSQTGVYYLAFTLITVATVIGKTGLAETSMRFASAAVARHEWDVVAGVRNTSLKITFIVSICASLILFILSQWLALQVFHAPDLTNALRVMSIAIVPFVLLNINSELLKSTTHIVAGTIIQAAAIPGISLLFLIAFNSFGLRTGATTAAAYASSVVAVFLLSTWAWRMLVPEARIVPRQFDAQRMLKTGLPILWASSASLVMSLTDTFLLGIWKSTTDVGLYAIATRIALLTSFVIVAVNSAVGPKFAALYAEGDISMLRVLMQRITLGMTLAAIPVLLLLTCYPRLILGIFGQQFKEAAGALIILAIGQFIEVATGAVGHLLMMSGHERSLRNNLAFSAILNVVLNLIAIPKYGLLGAATATATSLAVMNILCIVSVRRKLGFWPLPTLKTL